MKPEQQLKILSDYQVAKAGGWWAYARRLEQKYPWLVAR